MKDKNLDVFLKRWKNNPLIKEITNIDNFKEIIRSKRKLYLGIDPTSDSLHVGHLVPLTVAKQLNNLDCPIIVLIGDSTSRIGDPSFRTKKRTFLTSQTIAFNSKKITAQIKTILPNALIVSNSEWHQKLTLIDFLSKIGSLFTINKILEKESLSASFSRQALFYSDFSYILLQAYDFYYLWKEHDCSLQIGGSDQYPNILFGIDLIEKLSSNEVTVCGLTTNLLLNSQGTKISKTSNDQIWLDLKKTPLHDIYQFFYNLNDSVAMAWNDLFANTQFSSVKFDFDHKNKFYQKQLFFVVVQWIFGRNKRLQSENCLIILSKNSFSEKNLEELRDFLPFFKLPSRKYQLWEIVVSVLKLSKNTVIKLIQTDAIKINNQLVNDPYFIVDESVFLYKRWLMIKKGKKRLFLVSFN